MTIPARSILFAAVCLVMATALAAQQKDGDGQGSLVIAHVTVIDATGASPKPDTTVVIVGDRIAIIGKGSQTAVPKRESFSSPACGICMST